MQEIQTEAIIGMFRDTETIQNNPTIQQTKFTERLKTGAFVEWPLTSMHFFRFRSSFKIKDSSLKKN